MARSSKEQVASNRQRIVTAASELFRSRGYDAVGIADVMKAAGMTQGGFYKHFATKEALACEAWNAGFAQVEAAWTQPSGEGGGGDGTALAAIVDYYLSDRPPEDRCPMQGHGEDAARDPDGGALRAVYADGAGALYRAFLARAGETIDDDRARLLFVAMIGTKMLERASGDVEWLNEIKLAVANAAKIALN